MKKYFNYAILGAIAFVGATGFTACSSEDEIVNNPNYNPENNSVKTAITMNVGRGANVTRMASTITQNNDQPFRGMYQVYIYPANVVSGTSWAPITDGSSISAPVVSNEAINPSTITASASSRTYSNVQVTIGTNNFLFYGRGGTAAGAPSETTDKLSNGFTIPTFPTTSGTTADISFASQAIVGSTLPAGWTTPVEALKKYLDDIKDAFGTTALTNAAFESYRLDFMKPNTPRAGSAAAVLATAQHLYDVISALTTGLSEEETTIKTNVLAAIAAAPASISETTLSWKSDGDLASYTTFPANVGLPLGAAQYQYDPTANSNAGGFVYLTTATTNIANTAIVDYIYPSELFYFTNTPLKESANDVTWPNTTNNWIANTSPWNASTENWTDAVQASSKNIALVNNIQYGTAQLATYVRCTPDANNKLFDNSKVKDPNATQNKAIAYSENMFPLTGILIGAQPSTVGWNFLNSGSFSRCVYDKNVTYYKTGETPTEEPIYANSAAATSDTYFGPNFTLLYDNAGYDKTYVNVCLEFENNSNDDFYGRDGLIKKGQKFYLIGKLDYTNVAAPTTFPTAVGNKDGVYYPSIDSRAFIQDYTTNAKFTITAGSADDKGSLAHALSCIPDLKAVTQEIGLSVDLEWTPGLTFTVNLGE